MSFLCEQGGRKDIKEWIYVSLWRRDSWYRRHLPGSGQKELLEAVAGLQMTESGSVRYITEDGEGKELEHETEMDIKNGRYALSFVPEDRLGMGLVGSME